MSIKVVEFRLHISKFTDRSVYKWRGVTSLSIFHE